MQSEGHNETVCAARKDRDYSFTADPSDARKGIISLLAVMVGFSFTSSSSKRSIITFKVIMAFA